MKAIYLLLLLVGFSIAQVQPFYAVPDTNSLKTMEVGLGSAVYMQGYAAGNVNGAGIYLVIDSAYTEGSYAFDHPTRGYQWYLNQAVSVANNAVDSSKIAAGAVQTSDLADSSITSAKIATAAVTVATKAALQLVSESRDGFSVFVKGNNATYVCIDSTYPEDSYIALGHATQGKQWVIDDYQKNQANTYATWFGVIPDDELDDRESLQAAINHGLGVGTLDRGAKIILPRGDIYLSAVETNKATTKYCLLITSGVELIGQGPGGNAGYGTRLILSDSQCNAGDTLVAIVDRNWLAAQNGGSTNWSHWFSLRDFNLKLNADNNEGRLSGIEIGNPGTGELAYVSRIAIGDVRGYGFKHRGSATLTINGLNVNYATDADTLTSAKERIAFWHNDGQANVTNISTDLSNPAILFNGGQLLVNGLKLERHNSGFAGNEWSCAIRMDSAVAYSSIAVLNIRADRGNASGSPAGNLIEVIGETSQQPQMNIIGGQATGWKNIFYRNLGGTIDSIRVDTTNINQQIRLIGVGEGASISNNLMFPYLTSHPGIELQNHLGAWYKSYYYGTDQKLHIIAPRSNIILENYQGTDILNLNSSVSTFYGPLRIDSSYLQLKEMTAPSSPAANLGNLYLQADGSGNTMLLIKFANGDVDTLATDQ